MNDDLGTYHLLSAGVGLTALALCLAVKQQHSQLGKLLLCEAFTAGLQPGYHLHSTARVRHFKQSHTHWCD